MLGYHHDCDCRTWEDAVYLTTVRSDVALQTIMLQSCASYQEACSPLIISNTGPQRTVYIHRRTSTNLVVQTEVTRSYTVDQDAGIVYSGHETYSRDVDETAPSTFVQEERCSEGRTWNVFCGRLTWCCPMRAESAAERTEGTGRTGNR